MADTMSKAARRRIMQAIKAKDTRPELLVRSLVHRMGYRFRLHRRDLPGTPDLVFPRLKAVIFVHGCFWHRHSCKNGQSMPATRRALWRDKFSRNVARDRVAIRELRRAGWRVLIVWECHVRPSLALASRLEKFLAMAASRTGRLG
jgi:DNA mismatch endonuclease (patch repair protein)